MLHCSRSLIQTRAMQSRRNTLWKQTSSSYSCTVEAHLQSDRLVIQHIDWIEMVSLIICILFKAGFNPSSHCEYPIVPCKHPCSTVRSMPFEVNNDENNSSPYFIKVSSNASTHWKKSFAAIWATLYDYYFKMGQLTVQVCYLTIIFLWILYIEESSSKKENEGVLAWGRVKEMVRHFISSRSEVHVRPSVFLANKILEQIWKKYISNSLIL